MYSICGTNGQLFQKGLPVLACLLLLVIVLPEADNEVSRVKSKKQRRVVPIRISLTQLRVLPAVNKKDTISVNSKKRKREESPVKTSIGQIEGELLHRTIVVKKHPKYVEIDLIQNSNKNEENNFQNYFTMETMKELKEAFVSAQSDPDCRAVLLNSSGSVFCSGIDLTQLVGPNKKHLAEEMAQTVKDLILAFGNFHKLVVAAVNGDAMGLGLSLLTLCDVVVASDNATFSSIRQGCLPEGAVTLTLPQAVGSTVANEMLLQGRILTARQALDYKLVTQVLHSNSLTEQVVLRMKTLVSNKFLAVMETNKAMERSHTLKRLAIHLEHECCLLPTQWLAGHKVPQTTE